MPTAKAGYFLKDGTRVPSVTTILSKFKEAGGLMHWAWQCGIDGKDYRQVRDEAASSGTIAHDMVEQWVKDPNKAYEVDREVARDTASKAENAFRQFLQWAGNTKFKIQDTELALISEKHKFGGTLDSMLVNDKLSLGDWKTSNSIYSEYLMQVAAYGILWEENFPDKPIEGGYHILRFAKDHPDFSHHFYGDLEEAKEGFILLRRMYDIKSKLDKRVK